MNKKCFKCNQSKQIEEFYTHPRMADGHLNKCKSCANVDSRSRYLNPDTRPRIIEYEKHRGLDPERRKKAIEYQRHSRLNHPEKHSARRMVGYAISRGTLIKEPCVICSSIKVEAHHKDYSKPLDIEWLCRQHHLLAEGKIPF